MGTLSTSESWLIEEYKNIANSHDRLRDIIIKLFNYFLLISALPLTALGLISKSDSPVIQTLGVDVVAATFIGVAFGNIFLAASILDARYSQYRYAKAVNLIRRYFHDKDTALEPYLYMPISAEKPNIDKLGYVGFELYFVAIVACIYFLLGLRQLHLTPCESIVPMIVFLMLIPTLVWLIRKPFIETDERWAAKGQ